MMNPIQDDINLKICEEITQLQADLAKTLKKIFEQTVREISLEQQEEVTKAIEGTQQILERFKSKYTTVDLFEENSTMSNLSISGEGT